MAPHQSDKISMEQSVAKPEWGTKRICPSCGTRYYDLLRDPVVCPKCSTPYDPEAFLKSRRARPAAPVEREIEPVEFLLDLDRLDLSLDRCCRPRPARFQERLRVIGSAAFRANHRIAEQIVISRAAARANPLGAPFGFSHTLLHRDFI